MSKGKRKVRDTRGTGRGEVDAVLMDKVLKNY